MNYLSVENVSKNYSEKLLFENITFGISQGQKVALVGINGCGKSTLLKLLAGVENPDSGKISFRNGLNVAFLSQSPEFEAGHTILDALFDGGTEITETIKKYQHALAKVEASEEADELQGLLEDMERLHAWDYESTVEQVLGKLGIDDVEQMVDELSGGQKKRVALAKVLIQQPDFLILDEPTNHLDLGAIEWLENYLASQNISLIMVTHDRYFLERVTNEILEIDQGNLYKYKGNYVYFLEKKQEREEIEAAEVGKARNLMKKELEWMRRQPKARGTKAKYREDAFYDLQDKASKNLTKSGMEIKVKTTRQGRKILELEHLYKSYGDLKLIEDFSYTFKRGDRIGIVGKNGVGKSTFLKILTKDILPDSGEIDFGQTTNVAHYTQEEIVFDEKKRVADVMKEQAELIVLKDGSEVSASQLLNLFQFPPATQYNMISKLSGGEKRRLQLLLTLIKQPNFLILDEPTNDLDILTLNIFEEYLNSFEGCLMIVSHDRYFMDKLVDHLFVFEGDGVINNFGGNYTDYREKLLNAPKNTAVKKQKPKQEKAKTNEVGVKKLSFNEKRELETLEKEMADLENQKSVLVNKLNSESNNIDHETLAAWSSDIKQISIQLEEKENRWLELSE